jgi:hypothetical protein
MNEYSNPSFATMFIYFVMSRAIDRLCGLVVRVLSYRSGGPGSIPGTARFSEKKKKKGG